jgi:hypothetical protein
MKDHGSDLQQHAAERSQNGQAPLNPGRGRQQHAHSAEF